MPESEEAAQPAPESAPTPSKSALGSTQAQPAKGLGARIKRMSPAALLLSGAVVLVVGLVVGLAAGYKIEQQRTKNDVKNAKAQAVAQSGSNQAGAPATSRLTGKVGTAAPGLTMTVGGKPVVTSATTVVVKASAGSPSDIKAGDRVVSKPKQGQTTQAEEIIVLPANSKLGSPVVSATANSMTITSGGKNVTVNTTGATVLTVTAAKTTEITPGAKVITQVRRTNGSTLTATEVILLPATSKFA